MVWTSVSREEREIHPGDRVAISGINYICTVRSLMNGVLSLDYVAFHNGTATVIQETVPFDRYQFSLE